MDIYPVGSSALPDSYIYTYKLEGRRPKGSCVFIRQSISACGISDMYTGAVLEGVSEVPRNHSRFSLDDGRAPFRLQRFTRHT